MNYIHLKNKGNITEYKEKKIKSNTYVTVFFLFVGGVFLTFSTLTALEPLKAITQYQQESWQAERGLTQNSALVIRQTSDGYIWLGTLNGLVRFDGIGFKTFNKENTNQLKDNTIKALHEDRKGNLWIGTWEGGLSCLTDGQFKTDSIENYPSLKEITAIFEDREGALWIGTSNNGLTRLKNGEFRTFSTEDGLASNKVRAFFQDDDGRLWIGTSAGLSIHTPSGRFSDYKGENGRFDEYVISMYKTKKGELWFGCLNGLYSLRDNTITHFGTDNGLPNLKIMCLYEDSHRNLWAGTESGGLIRVKNGGVETFPPGDVLASSHISSIYEGREHNLWLGSPKEGLHRLRDTPFVSFTTREGLNHDTANCITEDTKGILRVGTKKGVNEFRNGELILGGITGEELSDNSVTAIIEDSKGTLWLGTEAGLYVKREGRPEPFNDNGGKFKGYISRLWEDKKTGAVWILTPDHLSRFHEKKLTVIQEKISKNALVCFLVSKNGSVWIGTHGSGLLRRYNGKVTIYATREGIAHNEVECLYEDNKGILYIGTRGGLSILADGKITKYTTQNGLIDSYIYHILEDDSDHLWLTGRIGFSRIRKKKLYDFINKKIEIINPEVFNESDGIKNPFCGQCIKTRDGKLWFATRGGVTIVDPMDIKKSASLPPAVIEELRVDGEARQVSGLRSRYGEDTPVVISPGKKRLEFYYTAPSFVKPRHIKFRLKLDGYDKDWVDMGNLRSTTYTGLSPGEYTFRVKVRNNNGEWSEEGASFSFYLKPYFWQTTWFFILCALAVISIGFLGYRFRVGQLKRREKELGKLVELRTRDLKERNIQLENAQEKIQHSKNLIEAKNQQLEEQSEKLKEMDKVKSRFFANISHEFRTPLTLIMGPLEQMMAVDTDKKQKKKLSLMLRNSQRLLGLINQLLELSRFESGKVKLQAARQNVIPLLKGITANFESLADQHELDLTFHAETEDITLYVDAEKLEDVVCNLLINASKFTPPGGQVTVTAKEVVGKDETFPSGFLRLSISDTGPGIPREQLAHIFDRFYQAEGTYENRKRGTGIGLALVRELVLLHHGKIDVYSREGKGTEFIIALPMGDAHLEPDEPKASAPIESAAAHDRFVPALYMETADIDETDNTTVEKDIDPFSPDKEVILVVEDSADVREYIGGSLEPHYTVVGAEDGETGIQKAREVIPDLIISDIMMPGIDGYELCKILKEDIKTSHVPIILLTAKAAEDSIVQGLETGADDYITKPFSTQILMARIKNLIDLRRQLQLNITREMTLQPAKISVSPIDREFIKELKQVIGKNLADPDFNVEQLAKKLYMDRSTIYRKIHALTGESPTEFIRSCRLKRGAELIKNNFGTVLEVALEVGFSSANYFTKCFKKKFHQLPSEYQD